MGDIVQGPWGKNPPIDPEGKEILLDAHIKTDIITNVIFNELEKMGINVDNYIEDGYIKDVLLIAESIRSYLLKHELRYHPCQDIADNLFYSNGKNYQTFDSLHVEFK